jgi:glyoxylase-like metal-dependent hydrolase (beta-lactamase superfamily II)
MSTTRIQQQLALQHFWSGEGNLSYLLQNPQTQETILIDPDLEILGTYLLTLDREGLVLTAVLDTHTHADHASAGPALAKLTGVPYVMNEHAPSSLVTERIRGNDTRVFAGIPLRFIYSPGHTQDLHVIVTGQHLFTGDLLFNRSCGRCDLPGGDAGAQFDALQHLMASFPEDCTVHPGHDYGQQDSSTLALVKAENPRVQFTDRDEFIRFMAEFYADNEKPDDLEYYVAFNTR